MTESRQFKFDVVQNSGTIMDGIVKYDISPISGTLANVFIFIVNVLYLNIKTIGKTNIYPTNFAENLEREDYEPFDFIIVGGGTSGCVLAMKLSYIKNFTVLLLEEGDYPPASSDVPGFQIAFPLTEVDWQFRLQPQSKACQGMLDNVCILSRGKTLGGTSVIHDMNYIRSLPDDTDRMDLPSWNLNLTTHLYNALENYQKKSDNDSLQYDYGKSGRTFLDKFEYSSPIRELLQQFYQQTNHSEIPADQNLGYTSHLVYSRGGVRLNAAKLYISPIRERPNLAVALRTHVKSVDMGNKLDIKARGVHAVLNGRELFIRAKKEVILMTGPINNVKLLLKSGIGSEKYLQKLNIPVVHNVPNVGKNLQFHLSLPVFYTLDSNDTFNQVDYVNEVINFVLFRKGNLSNTNLNDFVHYINTATDPNSIPNLAIYHKYFKRLDLSLETVLKNLRYTPPIINSLMQINREKVILMFTVTLLRPESRGEVLLNEKNIEGQPRIFANFLTDKENADYDTLVSGFRYLSNLTHFELMQKHKLELLDFDIPNCRNYKFCTMHHVKCYIMTMSYPSFDIAGTTKMGLKCMPDTVVEPDLEVKGVRGLRVGDASVLQYIPSGNTGATEALIAFRLGEIIRKRWLTDYMSPFQFNDTETEDGPEEEESSSREEEVSLQMKSLIPREAFKPNT